MSELIYFIKNCHRDVVMVTSDKRIKNVNTAINNWQVDSGERYEVIGTVRGDYDEILSKCKRRFKSKDHNNVFQYTTTIDVFIKMIDNPSKPKDKGVSWCATRNQWLARITYKKKTYYLGYHYKKQNAIDAYNTKRAELKPPKE